MKLAQLILAVWLSCGAAAEAAFIYSWDSGFANGGVVPDGNTTGWSDTRTISGLPTEITDVNVTINVAGGYNGDLYITLAHSSGFSVLMNRVGRTSGNSFGYGDAGFNITLDDQAATTTDIHSYRNVSGWSISDGAAWRPDGRNVSPLSVTDGSSRTALLSAFNGLDANGTWTLFIADVSGGDVSQIISWGLEITAVPEPVTIALSAFGGLFTLTVIARRLRSKEKRRAAFAARR